MYTATIGIIGTGTVGGGVISILTDQRTRLKRQGVDITIKTICARVKPKDIALPKGVRFTKDVSDIYNDAEIDIVVELISDVKAGERIILKSLQSGKHVVSANKAALANAYPKIATILSNSPTLSVGIEAAVAGGIPIIDTLKSHLGSDPVMSIAGILNGTTNFIITKMEAEGLQYKEVLSEAQQLGYAEADPRADVDGYDARAKLSLLMQLVYGVHPHTDIATVGISRISEVDFQYVHMLDSTIRCLGIGTQHGRNVSGFVSPCVVHTTSSFAAVQGATNAVSIDSQYLQNTFLMGQGAGRYPTAVSVVADIIRIAKGQGYSIAPTLKKAPTFVTDYTGRFYIRLSITDKLGVIEKIGQLCKKNKISVDAILQLPVGDSRRLPFVITTNTCSSSQVATLVEQLQKVSFVQDQPFVMPIISEEKE